MSNRFRGTKNILVYSFWKKIVKVIRGSWDIAYGDFITSVYTF